jgi:hypothetical protein
LLQSPSWASAVSSGFASGYTRRPQPPKDARDISQAPSVARSTSGATSCPENTQFGSFISSANGIRWRGARRMSSSTTRTGAPLHADCELKESRTRRVSSAALHLPVRRRPSTPQHVNIKAKAIGVSRYPRGSQCRRFAIRTCPQDPYSLRVWIRASGQSFTRAIWPLYGSI